MKTSKRDIRLIKLGERLKEIRKSQNISQAQLAFESGLTEIQIRRIEKGQINTGVLSLIQIAEALNVDIKLLFEGEKPRRNKS